MAEQHRNIAPLYRRQVGRAETRILDLQAARVEAVVSTEVVDRGGDIIRASGWVLDNFLKHPVLLAGHDYGLLRAQIGEWESMEIKGKRLVGVARYYIGEGNQDADWGWKLVSKGMAAYSVGFIPDMDKAKEIGEGDGWSRPMEFMGQELLEVSQVTIPANPEALQRMQTLSLHPVMQALLTEAINEQPGPRPPLDARQVGELSTRLLDGIRRAW